MAPSLGRGAGADRDEPSVPANECHNYSPEPEIAPQTAPTRVSGRPYPARASHCLLWRDDRGRTPSAVRRLSTLAARRRGVPGRARLLSLAGGAALSVGGLLGGHLSFTRGVGVNETAFDEGPRDWTTVDSGELQDGKPISGLAGDTPVLLLRHDGHLHALHNRCSHRGCELSTGQVEGESVTCPCHGSRFSLRDGSIERGPATARQPVFETRESDGRIEVRLPVA